MTRVLLDVNVILDVLLDRRPFADSASDVWRAVETGRAEGFLSAHAVTTIHYLNTKAVGKRMARDTTSALLSVFAVAEVDTGVVADALALDWADFEDAVTAAAARAAGCEALVTRNPRDFKGAPIRVVAPPEAVGWLEAL
jgi:predicted nucleic acid-binding protein